MKHKELFKSNPVHDVVYKTSDGYYFWEFAKAKSHANTLEDKNVKKYYRDEPTSPPTPLYEEKGENQELIENSEGEEVEVDTSASLSEHTVKPQEDASDEEDTSASHSEQEKQPNYSGWKLAELQAKVAELGLDAGAAKTKADFIQLLMDNE